MFRWFYKLSLTTHNEIKMKIGKNLTKIVLTSILTLGAIGCSNSKEYHFKGKIGKDQVRFYENILGEDRLVVVKPDGTIVKYEAGISDFKVSKVKVTIDENTTEYVWWSDNPLVKRTLKSAQSQFDFYLSRIYDIQSSPFK